MEIIDFAGNTINENHITRMWLERHKQGNGVFIKMELSNGVVLESLCIDNTSQGRPAKVNAEKMLEQLKQQILDNNRKRK